MGDPEELMREQLASVCACLWDAILVLRVTVRNHDLNEDAEARISQCIGTAEETLANLPAEARYLAEVHQQAMEIARLWKEAADKNVAEIDGLTEAMDNLAQRAYGDES